MQPIVVVGRHRPHELLFLGLSVLTGAVYLGGLAPTPNTVAAVLPSWEIPLWAALLLASGVTGLAGCLWPRNVTLGLRVEAGAMLLGAAALLLYATSVFVVGGLHGLFAGGSAVAWMAANIARAAQILRDLRHLTRGTPWTR